MRMRTKKTERYFTISNETAQDSCLSFESLGLLTYCLSMPYEWEFHPKVIWKLRNCGRDTCYNLFNELIQSYHCIRISKPNPNSPNLRGEIEYEIFDDIKDCKERILELQNTEKFLEHGDNFKKCFRHPDSQYPEIRDPENQYTIKETEKIKETTTEKQQQQAAPVSAAVSLERKNEKQEIYPILDKIDIPHDLKVKATKKFDEQTVKDAVGYSTDPGNPPRVSMEASFWNACKNKLSIKPPKEDVEDKNKSYAMKYDNMKNSASQVTVYNTYVEVSNWGVSGSIAIGYKEKGFIEQFNNALRKNNFQILEEKK